MTQSIKVVHFLNQFFAGVGGEEQANLPVEIREGAVGPGRALQAALGDSGQVVATIVSGDNYFTEESAASARAVTDALSRTQPDVVVAGPAFNAGRYGLACGEVCVLANSEGIPAVTAMYPENPGVLEYDTRAYIVPTDESPVRMQEIVGQLARLATKLGSGEGLGPAEEEGYLPRGIRQPGLRTDSAAKRSVDMLMARMGGGDWVHRTADSHAGRRRAGRADRGPVEREAGTRDDRRTGAARQSGRLGARRVHRIPEVLDRWNRLALGRGVGERAPRVLHGDREREPKLCVAVERGQGRGTGGRSSVGVPVGADHQRRRHRRGRSPQDRRGDGG